MKKSVFVRILKGVLFALILSLLLICVLAILLKSVELSQKTISAICIIIKLISVFFACLISVKTIKKKHGLLGGISAIIYWLLCYCLISIFNGFGFDFMLIVDFCATILAGIICAFIVRAISK